MSGRIVVPLICATLSACSVVGSGNVLPSVTEQRCDGLASIETGNWELVQIGVFSFRLPASYQEQKTRSIDSVIRRWDSRNGPAVDLDYGLYTRRFERGPHSRMREPITECLSGDSTAAPQIVIYRTLDERHAVGLYWPVPGGRQLEFGANREVQREALWLEASSRRQEDLPELMAIIQSVELRASR